MTAASHTVREVAQARTSFPYIDGLSAQRKVELLTLRFAPAFTGGLIAYSHLHSEWQGLLVFACVLAAVTLLRRPRYPLHLIPLASAIVYILAPPLGAAAAVLISISYGSPSTVTVGHGGPGPWRMARNRARRLDRRIASAMGGRCVWR